MQRVSLKIPGLSVPSYDPVAHGQMKADTFNALVGELTGMDCPKCKNRGTVAFPKGDGSIFTRECGCMRARRCFWEMERSGLKNSIRELTFEAFTATEPWQQALKAGAMAYVEKPEGWLLFCGQSGSGKTHLATAVCRARLLAGDEVRYMSWRDRVAELKALSLDSDRREALLDGYKKAQLLYIDDLYKVGRAPDGSVNPSGADVSLAFEMINYRYINRLPTVISTERLPRELVDIDEATGSRILERAEKNSYAVERDQKRNYRLRGVNRV